MTLALVTCLLCAPAMTPLSSPDETSDAREQRASASAPLAFEVRRAAGGDLARGVVVTLEALEVEGLDAGTQRVERTLDGAFVRFEDLRLGRYRATIFSGGAELSFELVAATSLGGGLLVGGLLAVTLNPCGEDGSTGGNCRSDLRTAWGIGLSSVGGAGVGTGITMIAVGRRQRLRLRPGVDVKVGRAGLTLQGRF
jgi:hypothetical protein